jgi:hypothetical protein
VSKLLKLVFFCGSEKRFAASAYITIASLWCPMHHNPTHTHTRALDPRCNSLGCLNDRVVLFFPLSMQVCRYASHFETAIHRLYLSTASIAVPTRVSLCLSFDVSGYQSGLQEATHRCTTFSIWPFLPIEEIEGVLFLIGHKDSSHSHACLTLPQGLCVSSFF